MPVVRQDDPAASLARDAARAPRRAAREPHRLDARGSGDPRAEERACLGARRRRLGAGRLIAFPAHRSEAHQLDEASVRLESKWGRPTSVGSNEPCAIDRARPREFGVTPSTAQAIAQYSALTHKRVLHVIEDLDDSA